MSTRWARQQESQSMVALQTPATGVSKDRLLRRNPFIGELTSRAFRLLESVKAQGAKHLRGLCELNVPVSDDLHPISPRIEEVEPPSRQYFDSHLRKPTADGVEIVDDQSEVTLLVRALCSFPRQCDELVTHVDERHVRAPAPQ